MGELNWKWVYIPYLDAPDKQKESAIKAGYAKVYFKSEADKVLADKDKDITILQQSLQSSESVSSYRKRTIKEYEAKVDKMRTDISEKDTYISNLKNDIAEKEKESRHSNHKRCLAMAEMCNARYDEEDAKVNGHYSSWEYISKEMKYWERWGNRWLKIAEQFKEAK